MTPTPEQIHGREVAVRTIQVERQRQDDKWGEQNHDAGTWALILLEEIGEWARAELETRFGGPDAGKQHHEAVHMAAVAQAIVECIDRREMTEAVLKVDVDLEFWLKKTGDC